MPWRSAIVWRSVLPAAFSGGLKSSAPGLDLAPRQVHLQQLVHLLQLQIVVGEDGELAFLAFDRAFAALEVEARRDLAGDAGERVVDLGEIDPRDDVEARHPPLLGSRQLDAFGHDIAQIDNPISLDYCAQKPGFP